MTAPGPAPEDGPRATARRLVAEGGIASHSAVPAPDRDRETAKPRRRRVPSQCLGCGQFVGPASSAWATGYHTECEPGARR